MTSLVSLILQPSITQWSQRTGALEDLLGIYGSAMDQTRAKQWLRAFAEADFSGLPPVIILSAERMPELWGGYSREKNRIYISSDCPPEHLAAVLLEEVGTGPTGGWQLRKMSRQMPRRTIRAMGRRGQIVGEPNLASAR